MLLLTYLLTYFLLLLLLWTCVVIVGEPGAGLQHSHYMCVNDALRAAAATDNTHTHSDTAYLSLCVSSCLRLCLCAEGGG